MELLKKIIELDFAYLETFTKRIDTGWGCFFCNEAQPSYYNANHAHIHLPTNDPKTVIAEVVSFYQTRNLIPRIYMYDPDNHPILKKELEAHGFGYEEFIDPVQLWNGLVPPMENDPRLLIERVTEDNFSEALEIECSIKEFGGREVREAAFTHEFKHPAYTYYLLRYEGKPCATACMIEHGKQARMESVATLEEFRGRGLIGSVIRHIQREVAQRKIENLWVFPINKRVEKVYQKNGFTTIGTFKTGHAFLGGKSIQEIYES